MKWITKQAASETPSSRMHKHILHVLVLISLRYKRLFEWVRAPGKGPWKGSLSSPAVCKWAPGFQQLLLCQRGHQLACLKFLSPARRQISAAPQNLPAAFEARGRWGHREVSASPGNRFNVEWAVSKANPRETCTKGASVKAPTCVLVLARGFAIMLGLSRMKEAGERTQGDLYGTGH